MDFYDNNLEIKEYSGEGYMPVIDFESWRVAVLNYCDELLPENISKMQKHDESDEVFVLLRGNFVLYIGLGCETLEDIKAINLEPLKLYNVKKGSWHTHSLSKDAMVLIIENKNTCMANSPEIELQLYLRQKLNSLYESIK